MNLLAPRLPGLSFSVETPEPEAILPRMDITAFVGLASSGPLHTPVAVEDSARFRDLFGPDLPLAWEECSGKIQTSYLGQAVEAFFRNGGQRCWIVRVADQVEAETNIFPVPGLVQAVGSRPSVARARSEGSWSDDLCIGAVRAGEALNLVDFDVVTKNDGTRQYQADIVGGPQSLQAGDMLQLTFPQDDLILFLPLKSVNIALARQRLVADEGYWFLRYETINPPGFATDVVHLVPEGNPLALPFLNVELPFDDSDPYTVDLDLTLSEAPIPGELLRIVFEDGRTLLLPIDDVEALPPWGSPAEDGVRVSASQGYWPLAEDEGIQRFRWNSPDPFPLAERITFALCVWRDQELLARQTNLAFCSQHPRFWGRLPTDAAFFRLPDGRRRSAPKPIELAAAEAPRFPLAGPQSTADITLPIGMPYAANLNTCQRPLGSIVPETRLRRNGLSKFSAALFLDDSLRLLGSKVLLTEANQRLFVRREALHGIHTLVPLQEVSLVSVPDAIHLGWEYSPPAKILILPAPRSLKITMKESNEHFEVQWTKVKDAARYLLQEAADPTFARPATRYQGPDLQVKLGIGSACPQRTYYRVRAEMNGHVSPWSNTKFRKMPDPQFKSCQDAPLEGPTLQLTFPIEAEGKKLLLSWNAIEEGVGYEVQEANDPSMVSAATVASGVGTSLARSRRPDRISYFRVRARRDGDLGPWSNTVFDYTLPPARPVLKSTAVYRDGDLLDVQRSLLRLCHSRGDMMALLSLPAHYRQEQTLAHRTALGWLPGENGRPEGPVPPLNVGEAAALSYGALYHPWLYTPAESRSETIAIVKAPPDGAICGTFAARAINRGAWIAPANERLLDVAALEPAVDRPEWQTLFEAQVNIVRQGPRGFLCMSADTLSREPDLRPINVRRLLILLRRLALREGMRYVFQSHDDALRRLIRHQFDRILADMYARGAFAGSRPEAAYRVITGDQINTRQQTEQGRLLVELRVAPSRPMAFITVRLLQTGTEGLTIEES